VAGAVWNATVGEPPGRHGRGGCRSSGWLAPEPGRL